MRLNLKHALNAHYVSGHITNWAIISLIRMLGSMLVLHHRTGMYSVIAYLHIGTIFGAAEDCETIIALYKFIFLWII